MSERISALEMAIGIEMRLYDREQLADWVDAEVLASDRVEGPLLELTSLHHKSEFSVLEDLHALAGVSAGPSDHLYLACLGHMVDEGRIDVRAAISCVYTIMHEGDDLTDAERGFVYRLDQEWDWAVSESHGTLEQVRANFLAFTSRCRHLLAGVR